MSSILPSAEARGSEAGMNPSLQAGTILPHRRGDAREGEQCIGRDEGGKKGAELRLIADYASRGERREGRGGFLHRDKKTLVTPTKTPCRVYSV